MASSQSSQPDPNNALLEAISKSRSDTTGSKPYRLSGSTPRRGAPSWPTRNSGGKLWQSIRSSLQEMSAVTTAIEMVG